MNDERRSAPEPPPAWDRRDLKAGPAESHQSTDEPPLNRFLGGSPGAVFLRLLFVSLIVGAFLVWLDIRPRDIFRGAVEVVERIWGMGFDAIRELADYILAGAAIVIPVWIILRLLTMRSSR
jgi:hypothetical protein